MKDADKTIPQIFFARAEEHSGKPLFLCHRPGDFPPFTHRGKNRYMQWDSVADSVKKLAMGLLALGVRPGEAVCIMADTSPEWVMADLALLSIGAATGSIYPNNLAVQAGYILNDLNSRFVFVQGAKRRDGFLGRKNKSPQLKRIITMDCEAGDDPLCMGFADLMALGESEASRFSGAFEDAVAAGRLSDIASYIYTSGTTGIPKGAVHTHESLTYTVCTGAAWLPIEPGWVDLCFLPMAHIFEQFAGPFLDIYRGDGITAFARSIQTVVQDLGFVKPHYCRAAPRLFEKIYAAVWSKCDVLCGLSAEGLTEALQTASAVRVAHATQGDPAPEGAEARLERLDAEHFARIRELLFGGNLQFCVAGGAPLSPEINAFFWSIGIPVYELYGMTETGGVTTNRPGKVRLGSVGASWPGEAWPGGGTEVRLSESGEILVRGPNVMREYHHLSEDTAIALEDGWMLSGDVGEVDADGFFSITDRIKDILITAGGKNVAPSAIESLLKEEPLISQVMVYGDRKKYLTALITLDSDELKIQAKALGIRGSYRKMIQDPRVVRLVRDIVDRKNQSLARYETIKDFILLERDLSIEDGELTPTLKVKRKEVIEKYRHRLDPLYSE